MIKKKRKAAPVESPLAAYLHGDVRKLVADYCDPLTLFELNPYDYATMRSRFLCALRDHVGIAEPEEFMRQLKKAFGIIVGHFLLHFLMGAPERAKNMTVYVAKRSKKLDETLRNSKIFVHVNYEANAVEAVDRKVGLDVLRMYFSPTRLFFLGDTTASALRHRTCTLDSRPADDTDALKTVLQLVDCLRHGFTYVGAKTVDNFIGDGIRHMWYYLQVRNAFLFLYDSGFHLPVSARLWLMNG